MLTFATRKGSQTLLISHCSSAGGGGISLTKEGQSGGGGGCDAAACRISSCIARENSITCMYSNGVDSVRYLAGVLFIYLFFCGIRINDDSLSEEVDNQISYRTSRRYK